MAAQMSPQTTRESVNWPQVIVRMVILAALFPALLFIAAGTVGWLMGWVYIVLAVGITLMSRWLMIRRNPGLARERMQALSREDTKSWDKVIVPIVGVVGPLVQIIVAGLDYRFDWSPPFAQWVEILGIGLMIVGYIFGTWAMLVNPFYSSAVRIQTDRGQHVVNTGPYRIVRHPSYIGALVGHLGASLVLSSLWSLVPFAVVIAILVLRTGLEDATLQNELPGYRDYTQQTRYRLIPGVW